MEEWAAEREAFLLIFYDGQQGLAGPDENPTVDESRELWVRAVRDARPYREPHRDLDITVRRILEDPVMQDSRFSQLIQAADLIAYGAYQRHRQEHPEVWGSKTRIVVPAIKAYMKLANHWPKDSDYGVIWLRD